MNKGSGRYAVSAFRLRRRVMAAVAAVAVPLVAAGTAATPASAVGAVAGGPGVSVPAAVPGTRLWVKRYNGPANGADTSGSVAVSPDGATVFVTGTSPGSGSGDDYLTVAYSAATGARLWDTRYNGPANGADTSGSVAVSPDGATVFVTGTSAETGHGEQDYATVAYRASDGTQLWARRYSARPGSINGARAVSVARDGTAVFVTGTSFDASLASYSTVAYNAATGARLWVSRYAGSRARQASAAAVASPGGNRVFVTGYSRGEPGGGEASYVTVAYNAATGAQLWIRRYHGTAFLFDAATALAASAGAGTVFVTGRSFNLDTGGDYATVAYRASDGKQLWVRRYNGPAGGRDYADAVAVSGGGTVSVTGTSQGATSGDDYATVAYNAATGAQLWVRRYNGPGNGADNASCLASRGNGVVYVTGTSWGGKATRNDYATIAYDIRTGAQLWARRYNGPASSGDYARALAAAGGRVFVTGSSYSAASGLDYATIAYTG